MMHCPRRLQVCLPHHEWEDDQITIQLQPDPKLLPCYHNLTSNRQQRIFAHRLRSSATSLGQSSPRQSQPSPMMSRRRRRGRSEHGPTATTSIRHTCRPGREEAFDSRNAVHCRAGPHHLLRAGEARARVVSCRDREPADSHRGCNRSHCTEEATCAAADQLVRLYHAVRVALSRPSQRPRLLTTKAGGSASSILLRNNVGTRTTTALIFIRTPRRRRCCPGRSWDERVGG